MAIWRRNRPGPALIDKELQVRYYMDEHGGLPPSLNLVLGHAVIDHGPGKPMNMIWVNNNQNIRYSGPVGHLGIECGVTTGAQEVVYESIATGDKLLVNLSGSKKITVEIRAKVTNGSASGGRLFCINPDSSGNNQLGFNCTSTTSLEFWHEGIKRRSWDPGEGMNTWTAVLDTSQGTANNRVKIYKNGVFFTTTINSNPTPDDLFSGIATGYQLKCFNRGVGSRSVVAKIEYAAIYSEALLAAECLNNHQVLLLNSDAPRPGYVHVFAAAGGTLVTQTETTEVESLSAPTQTEITEVESKGAVSQPETTEAESISAALQTETTETESISAATQSETSETESLSATTQTETTELESQGAVSQPETTEVESLSATTQTDTTETESIEAATQTETSETESLSAVVQTETTETESEAAGTLVTQTETTELESKAITTSTEQTELESKGPALQTETTEVESLSAATQTETTEAESLSAVTQTETTETENKAVAGLVVSTQTTEVESRGAVSNVETSETEAKGLLTQTEATETESLALALGIEITEVESLLVALATETTETESLLNPAASLIELIKRDRVEFDYKVRKRVEFGYKTRQRVEFLDIQ